jgi:translation initiation factor 2B subunit (eIF-2B alpha/beta/delta family)
VTKNKIDSSGIEVTVKELTDNENARVKELSSTVQPSEKNLIKAPSRMVSLRNGFPNIKETGSTLIIKTNKRNNLKQNRQHQTTKSPQNPLKLQSQHQQEQSKIPSIVRKNNGMVLPEIPTSTYSVTSPVVPQPLHPPLNDPYP